MSKKFALWDLGDPCEGDRIIKIFDSYDKAIEFCSDYKQTGSGLYKDSFGWYSLEEYNDGDPTVRYPSEEEEDYD